MKTSEMTIRTLVAGGLICRYATATSFAYLSEPENEAYVQETLDRMGLRLAMTSEKSAFFAAERQGTPEAVTALNAEVNGWVSKYQQISLFAELVSAVKPGAFRLSPGDHIKADEFIAAATRNPAIGRKADAVLSFTKKGIKTQEADKILAVIDHFLAEGLLTPINAKTRFYAVTGMADRFWDIGENFISSIPGKSDEVEAMTAVQKDLFG